VSKEPRSLRRAELSTLTVDLINALEINGRCDEIVEGSAASVLPKLQKPEHRER